jgi:hypothetical protein
MIGLSSCALCKGPAELRVENLIGGLLQCGRCAEASRASILRAFPTCPHGKVVVLMPAAAATFCDRCADSRRAA